MNNLNSSHLIRNKDLNYYQPHNMREINRNDDRQIDNTPAWKKKKEGELKEDSSNKFPLFVISAGIFKYSAAVKPRPIPLDINDGFPGIRMRFVTSDTNKAIFCTHVDSRAGMNVINFRLHQCIMITNPDIL